MATLFENKYGQSTSSFIVNLDQVKNIRYAKSGTGYTLSFVFADDHVVTWEYPTEGSFTEDFRLLKSLCLNK